MHPDSTPLPSSWTVACEQCGTPFTVLRAWAKKAPVRFCSRACNYASKRLPPVACVCEMCGAAFERKRSEVERSGGRFCSRACSDQWIRPRGLEDPATRFWDKVDKSEPCWKWTDHVSVVGYGVFWLDTRNYGAHKAAWWLATGYMPTRDEAVGHTCDTLVPIGDTSYRSCVRNDEIGTYDLNGVTYERRGHLWLGTSAANNADRDAKGRTARGDRSGRRLHPERWAKRRHSPILDSKTYKPCC